MLQTHRRSTSRSSASATRCSRCRLRWPVRCSRRSTCPVNGMGDDRLDSRRDGGGAQRGDGIQSARRRPVRRAQPADRQSGAAARRHVARRGGGVCRRRVGAVRVRRVASESAVLHVVAGGARDRVLVFAGEALHDLDAAVSRPGHGGGAGRRLAGGRRARRVGAVAARARDRHVGRRIRRALCVPGSRLRSRARAPVDSGPLRRAARRWRSRAACTSSRSCAWWRCRSWRRSARLYLAGVAVVAALLAYEQSLVRADDLSQVKRAFDLNGYVGILYLLVLAASLYGQ